MGYGQLFARIPWKHLIGYAPEIVGVAQKIYENVKKTLGMKKGSGAVAAEKRELSLAELDHRIGRLESNEMQQAELVRDMARQVGELSSALRILSRRLQLTTLMAAAALVAVIVLYLTK